MKVSEHEIYKEAPTSIAHIATRTRNEGQPPISVAQMWIVDPHDPDKYIKLLQYNDTTVDSVLNPYVPTEYDIYVCYSDNL